MQLDPSSLVGLWSLEREIDDRRRGEVSRISGTLTLTCAGERVQWEEAMTWFRPEGGVDVRRALWLVAGDDGWWVHFEDGRPFHPWRPGEEVVHPCAPDTYRGLVTGTPQSWSVTWDATGPGKDYSMVTRLSRH